MRKPRECFFCDKKLKRKPYNVIKHKVIGVKLNAKKTSYLETSNSHDWIMLCSSCLNIHNVMKEEILRGDHDVLGRMYGFIRNNDVAYFNGDISVIKGIQPPKLGRPKKVVKNER